MKFPKIPISKSDLLLYLLLSVTIFFFLTERFYQAYFFLGMFVPSFALWLRENPKLKLKPEKPKEKRKFVPCPECGSKTKHKANCPLKGKKKE